MKGEFRNTETPVLGENVAIYETKKIIDGPFLS